MTSVKRHTIPADWRAPSLEAIAWVNDKPDLGGRPDKFEVSFLPMKAVEELTGKIDLSDTRQLREVRKGFTSFQNGDLIVAKITPCMENGKFAVVSGLKNGLGFGSTEFHVVRPKSHDILSKYLFYFVIQDRFRREARMKMTGSAGQLRVPTQFFREVQIPLPGPNEQRRIVAKIEELFSELDAAEASLKRVREKLKQYRAAVLKAAVEGKLTERWRADHPNVEPADQLLKRILTTRRQKWEAAQQAKFDKSGKPPPKGWRDKYEEPSAPDTTDLTDLPKGWCWGNLDQTLDRIESGASFRCLEQPPEGKTVGVVKVSAVSWGTFDETESKTCIDHDRIDLATLIGPDEFLFSRANTQELVGACVITRTVKLRLMLSDKILRFRFAGGLQPWYLWNLRSKFGRYEIERLATGNQFSMRNIGQDRIRSIRIPIPPLEEQIRIMEVLDQVVSNADALEAELDRQQGHAASLRQSILKRAFEGKLVAQDPTDEPAEKLLERIRSTRENGSPSRTRPNRVKSRGTKKLQQEGVS